MRCYFGRTQATKRRSHCFGISCGPSTLLLATICHTESIYNYYNQDIAVSALDQELPLLSFAPVPAGPSLSCAEGDRHACCPVRSYKSTLEKYINPDDIPSCYGGRAAMEWPAHEQPNRVYR